MAGALLLALPVLVLLVHREPVVSCMDSLAAVNHLDIEGLGFLISARLPE